MHPDRQAGQPPDIFMEENTLNSKMNLTHGLRKDEIWSCRFLWLVCFAVLLPVAIVARLSGWRWRPWPAKTTAGRSAIREASAMSETVVGTVFSAY